MITPSGSVGNLSQGLVPTPPKVQGARSPLELAENMAGNQLINDGLMSRLYSTSKKDPVQPSETPTSIKTPEKPTGGTLPNKFQGNTSVPILHVPQAPNISRSELTDTFVRKNHGTKSTKREPTTSIRQLSARPMPPSAQQTVSSPHAPQTAINLNGTAEVPADSNILELAAMSKNGSLGEKFVYLVPRETGIGETHNPYDLKVVKHSFVETNTTEYLTLSTAGVTHYRNDEGDFVNLDRWIQDYTTFNSIMKIPFFSKYRKWKTFYFWLKHVRRTIVASSKQHLEENLFLLNKDLSQPLIDIRTTCLGIQELTMYEKATETRSLKDYVEKLGQGREVAAASIERTTTKIKEYIEKACKACVMSYIPLLDPSAQQQQQQQQQPSTSQEAETSKEEKAPQRQTYIEQSQRRAVCRRLTAFIRLCDYMVVDSLVALAQDSVLLLAESVRYSPAIASDDDPEQQPESNSEDPKEEEPVNPATGAPTETAAATTTAITTKKANQPVYFIDIIFDGERIAITPELSSFQEATDSIIKGFVDTVTAVPRFIKSNQLKKFTRNSGAEQSGDEPGAGPDVRLMVERCERYVTTKQSIHDSHDTAFAEVTKYASTFDMFTKLHKENASLDRAVVKAADESLDWFRDEMQRYKTQSEDIDKIPVESAVAIFFTKMDKLKSSLDPSPKNCLRMLQDLLPEIAREKNAILLKELKSANEKLSSIPDTVEEFVSFDKFHIETYERLERYRMQYDNIREMYREMDIGEPRIEYTKQDSMVFYEGSKPEFDKLTQITASVEEGKETMKREFAEKVDQEIVQLADKLTDISERAGHPMIGDESEDMDEVITYVEGLMKEIDQVKERERELVGYQEGFQISDATPIPEIQVIHRDIADKCRLWQSLKEWQTLTTSWKEMTFSKLDAPSLENEVQKYDKTVKQVDRTLKGNPVVPKLRCMVEAFRLTMPVITCLKNTDLKDHHWQQIDEIVGKELSKDQSSWTLGVLIELNAMDFRDEISAVSYQATQEQQLNEMLGGVIQTWVAVEFCVNAYKDQKDAYVLGQVDEVIEQMDESMIVISTIATNRYCSGVLRQRVERWETDMRYMMECLDKWLEVQRKWMYLESIFSNGELQRQWMDDARSFLTVDKLFRELLKRTHDNPNVKTTLLGNNCTLLAQFKKDIESLERIEKRLEEKLELKRRLFPRFYFLSNDDLLDILAQIKNPEKIAPHTLKMFDGVKHFSLTESADITHMNSVEGEQVAVVKPVKARGPVEKWLLEAEGVMVQTLRRLAKVCVDDFEARDRTEWIFEHAVQLVLTVSMVYWQKTATDALLSENPKQELQEFRTTCYTQLKELAQLTSRNLDKVGRRMLATLILLDVHGRDLVNGMVEDGVSKLGDFGWTKQLRCYWETDSEGVGDLFIRQNNSEFTYGYEYLGAQGRLVITPLTDRIFMTITGALHLCLGASPSGPAGTGKTESVKDLAKGLGRLCIVYNCSDGVTYKMMEKFFSGLCQTGAWCCLDEFNRINIEVLSVVAQQLMEVREALLNQREDTTMRSFNFQGTPSVELKPTFGCFITMNPGYAGRTELPDNLKALFRPVAAMTPDFRMIAEVIFYSEGFGNAENLSLKITQLYKLSSEQLSPQHHYDFGMRALKSILVMAGDLKRSQPDTDEDLTLIIACNDANIPKFVADDIPLFKGIMSDLFPGVTIPSRDYPELLPAIAADMNKKVLLQVPTYVTKVLQFYETLIVRHGVMLVGAAGGGKSEARQILAASLTDLFEAGSQNPQAQNVNQHIINPKSISMGELYGSVDPNTNEWQDGILSIVVKQNRVDADAGSKEHEWIVFDGPVDTLWVESMNSVLDDSKLLCLDNGVRMKLPDTVHMLFEVADLAVASPATVSRCGMVYMDEMQLGWAPVIHTWAETKMKPFLGPRGLEYIQKIFETKLALGIEWLRTNGGQLIESCPIQIAESCCDLFYALCETQEVVFPEEGSFETDQEDPTTVQRNELIHVIFSFSFVWSVGGNLDAQHQEKFDSAVRTILDELAPFSGPSPVYDLQIDFKNRKFISWEQSVPDFIYSPAVPYFDILVPTVDTYRYSFLLRTLLACGKSVLFSGQTGTGKSAIISQTLAGCQQQLHLVNVTVQFSAKTSSPRTQDMIETKLKVKRKNILGAPVIEGTQMKVALFVDDLNMPALETFGASPPVELVRQMMGNGGFYDRKLLFWKHIQDVVVLSACGPPEGGRSVVTKRLTRMFNLLQIPTTSEDSMRKIFTAILNGFFSSQAFNKDVKAIIKTMVAGSVEVFQNIKEKLRPRPVTAHYTFNLRDLSKVFQGIMQVTPRTCVNPTAAVRLWIHENQRCFYDRLINHADRRVFTEDIMLPVLNQFPGKWSHSDLFEENPIVWGDFLVMGAPQEDRKYEEVTDLSRLPVLFENYLDEYNIATNKNLNLVFFTDHCFHLAKIVRVIRQPRGNSLLVGVGGSGKQTLTRLAASIVDFQLFTIEVDAKYSLDKFHEDLIELYNIAGIEGKSVVFLLNDSQMVNEGMVEDINNMLNSGEVPALFPPEEKDKKINAVTQAAQAAGRGSGRDEVFAYFIGRVRDNLRIVLCMSPVGDAFRTRCRNFPSLTNCCSIDWFDIWPTDALLQVAQRQLTDCDLGDESNGEEGGEGENDLRSILTSLCVFIHQSVSNMADRFYSEMRRHYYVTPTSYLEFLSVYLTLLDDKKKELGAQLHKVQNGKTKMNETTSFISSMQKEITEMKPILEQKRVENEEMLKEIETRKEKAAQVRISVSAQEAEASEKAAEATEIQQSAQKDLDQATPALNDAIKALEGIDKKDINEMKAYPAPPAAVEKTMNAVCILLKKPKFDWKLAKEVMSDINFINSLKTYDRDAMDEPTIKKLSKFVVDDPDFVPEKVGSQGSAACKSLCMWCRALHIYYYVAKEVEPKKIKLAAAQAELTESKAKLDSAQAALKAVEDEMAALQAQFDESVRNKEELEFKLDQAQRHLATAEVLTDSLGAEVVRWIDMISVYNKDMISLPANVFLASASIAYFGAFTPSYRQELVSIWYQTAKERGLPVSSDYSLVKTLGDPMQIREWQIMSLPTDQTSVENAILVQLGTDEAMKLRRWPLMIDPQGQANKWIRKMEGKNGLKVVKLSDPKYGSVMSNAIQNGTPLLIDDLGETLDPAMDSVLLKQVYCPSAQPNQLFINMGSSDNAIHYEQSFRLYMTTKMANPHYLPEVCIKVTLINFTVTMEGLEDQLLGDVVGIEKSELEETKNKIVKSVSDDKRKLKRYEDLILSQLENAKGNILDNQELIATLKQTQSTSALLSKRLVEAEEKAKSIDDAREAFRPVANRASILYFVIAELPQIDPMYQYSLDYCKKLVSIVVAGSPSHPSFEEHLDHLRSAITDASYSAVCRGIFNRHKTVYSLLICSAIQRGSGKISEIEWTFFNRASALVRSEPPPQPDECKFIPPLTWALLDALDRVVPAMSGLLEDFSVKPTAWKKWYCYKEPHNKEPPNGEQGGIDWAGKLNSFQKMLLLRTCREEKMLFALTHFVAKEMGEHYVTAPPLNLQAALDDSSPCTPIIFILSQGSDPTEGFLKWADEAKGRKVRSISLGQGQEKPAKLLIEAGKKAGDWVLLQNCHLGKSFMPMLHEIVAGLESDKTVKDDFRLWLTSMPATYFPVPVLQMSVKLTNEAPSGMKANLARCYTSIKEEELNFFESGPVKEKPAFTECTRSHAFKKLLFGACFFHSLILERKKFGPLGWNVKYEWNDTDINTSTKWLRLFIEENDEIPWDSMLYIIGEINYGGRVTDPIDRRTLHSILRTYFVKDILEDSYTFSESGVYRAPQSGDLQLYKDFIKNLPRMDEPEVFGMHENASLTFQLQESQSLLKTVLHVQPRATGASTGMSPEDLVKKKAAEIVNFLPEVLSLEEAGPDSLKVLPSGLPNSLSTVLRHEVEKFSNLQRVIQRSLSELDKALAGLTVLSESLDKMFQDFLSDVVPSIWQSSAYPSLKPLSSWMKDFAKRIDHTRQWLRNGEPVSFWLPGFFAPHGFMTGILQSFARQFTVSVDLLGFSFKILDVMEDEITEAPPSGVYVHGLYCDSWRWNRTTHTMEDSRPSEMYCPLTVVQFLPEKNHTKPNRTYCAPLYITTIRKGNITSLGASSNFICYIEAKTEKPTDYWVQKGSAVVCQLSE